MTTQYEKMSASEQRKAFGAYIFGRKSFKILDDDSVEFRISVCYGSDWHYRTISKDGVKSLTYHVKHIDGAKLEHHSDGRISAVTMKDGRYKHCFTA